VEYHRLPLDIQEWKMTIKTKGERKEKKIRKGFEERKVGEGENRERKTNKEN
jgi:hypothetical protein